MKYTRPLVALLIGLCFVAVKTSHAESQVEMWEEKGERERLVAVFGKNQSSNVTAPFPNMPGSLLPGILKQGEASSKLIVPDPPTRPQVYEKPRFLGRLHEIREGKAIQNHLDKYADARIGKYLITAALSNPAWEQALRGSAEYATSLATLLSETKLETYTKYALTDETGRLKQNLKGCEVELRTSQKGEVESFVTCIGDKDQDPGANGLGGLGGGGALAAFGGGSLGNDGGKRLVPFDTVPKGDKAFTMKSAPELVAKKAGGGGAAGQRDAALPDSGLPSRASLALDRQLAPGVDNIAQQAGLAVLGGGQIAGGNGFGGLAQTAGAINSAFTEEEFLLSELLFGEHIFGDGVVDNDQKQAIQGLKDDFKKYAGDVKYKSIQPANKDSTIINRLYIAPTEKPQSLVKARILDTYKATLKVMKKLCEFKKDNPENKGKQPLDKVGFWSSLKDAELQEVKKMVTGHWVFTPLIGDQFFELFQKQMPDQKLDCAGLDYNGSELPIDEQNAFGGALGGGGAFAAASSAQAALPDYKRFYRMYAELVGTSQVLALYERLEYFTRRFGVDDATREDVKQLIFRAMGQELTEDIRKTRELIHVDLIEFTQRLARYNQAQIGTGRLLPENQNNVPGIGRIGGAPGGLGGGAS